MAAPARVNINGNIYVCYVSGTSGTGGVPPSVVNGIGTDGGTLWSACIVSNVPTDGDVWTTATNYYAGQYIITSGGKYYLCTTGGLSGASEPTSTSDSVTDGTCVWQYLTVSTWSAMTQYSYGDYVTSTFTPPSSTEITVLYMNVGLQTQEMISGSVQPKWYWDYDAWFQVDGTVLWYWQQDAYTMQSDSDVCLFEPDLMIEGMRWAWKRAKGLDYQLERKDWEQSIKSSFGRFNGPIRVNMGDEMSLMDNWPNIPPGSWSVDG